MLSLAFKSLARRPLRSALTIFGLAMAVAVLACLSAFSHGYQSSLGMELNHMGFQMMLVPLGCPYDGAARVLKGKALENSLPESVIEVARHDPAVALAAPLLMVAQARPKEGRADMWVGLDKSALALKPWWRSAAGAEWFSESNSVILGCDAAEIEMRAPGDWLYSPETDQKLRVAGVLQRSGTSDDNLFFVPLSTAQRMFNQQGRLTAVAIRLNDPAQVRATSERLQKIPGAQVVSLTEMMGTFLNLVGAVRTLLFSVALVALTIGLLSVFNTLQAAVVERTNELCVMRAIGASRVQILGMITTEALLLSGAASLAGILIALVAGHAIENLVKQFVPLAPDNPLFSLDVRIICRTMAVGVLAGAAAGLFPAWKASRLQPAEALRVI